MKLIKLGYNEAELFMGDTLTRVFFSYETPVASYTLDDGYRQTSEYYSPTTTKHINRWLNGNDAKKESPAYFQKWI